VKRERDVRRRSAKHVRQEQDSRPAVHFGDSPFDLLSSFGVHQHQIGVFVAYANNPGNRIGSRYIVLSQILKAFKEAEAVQKKMAGMMA
jgi:hypothetical protein